MADTAALESVKIAADRMETELTKLVAGLCRSEEVMRFQPREPYVLDGGRQISLMALDEQIAIDYLTSIRWANGEFCPYCNHNKLYHFSDKRTYKCAQCRKRFSIKVGTVFENTKIPLRKWLAAIWLVTSANNDITSVRLATDLNVTQKTAWLMLKRLRAATRTRSFNRLPKEVLDGLDVAWLKRMAKS